MLAEPNDYLYLSQDDLYRFGNSTSPRLDHIRAHDVDLYELNGIAHIRANGKGISLLTEQEAAHKPGWLWLIPIIRSCLPASPSIPTVPAISLCAPFLI
jgi:hypothetical protein